MRFSAFFRSLFILSKFSRNPRQICTQMLFSRLQDIFRSTNFQIFVLTLDRCNFSHTCQRSNIFGVRESPWSNSLISEMFWWKWSTHPLPQGCQKFDKMISDILSTLGFHILWILPNLIPTVGEAGGSFSLKSSGNQRIGSRTLWIPKNVWSPRS